MDHRPGMTRTRINDRETPVPIVFDDPAGFRAWAAGEWITPLRRGPRAGGGT